LILPEAERGPRPRGAGFWRGSPAFGERIPARLPELCLEIAVVVEPAGHLGEQLSPRHHLLVSPKPDLALLPDRAEELVDRYGQGRSVGHQGPSPGLGLPYLEAPVRLPRNPRLFCDFELREPRLAPNPSQVRRQNGLVHSVSFLLHKLAPLTRTVQVTSYVRTCSAKEIPCRRRTGGASVPTRSPANSKRRWLRRPPSPFGTRSRTFAAEPTGSRHGSWCAVDLSRT